VDIRKVALFFAIAFLLFAVDLGCTYTTFAVLAVPIEFEVNEVFRDWVVRDGWLVSISKFTVLKTSLFVFAGWMIFKTRNRVATFILAQSIVSNHLVAISSHPTLWWMENLEHRALLLKSIAGVSLVLTFYGIRYLRARPRAPQNKPPSGISLPVCSQNL
jgi:lysylphosphatidylglycerol synthetase-like protein (DUF2156 family)